jgi:hypothetical protein
VQPFHRSIPVYIQDAGWLKKRTSGGERMSRVAAFCEKVRLQGEGSFGETTMRGAMAVVVLASVLACGSGQAVPGCSVTLTGDVSGTWPCTTKHAQARPNLGIFELAVQLDGELPFLDADLELESLAVGSYTANDLLSNTSIFSSGRAWITTANSPISLQVTSLGAVTDATVNLYDDCHGTLALTAHDAAGGPGVVNVTANF